MQKIKTTQGEFNLAFQVSRTILFEVRYRTLSGNKNPYFATDAVKFRSDRKDYDICGQCQEKLLPKGSVAYKFYKAYNKYHLQKLNAEQLASVMRGVEQLKDAYNFTSSDYQDIPFRKMQLLSMENIKTINK